MLWPGAHPGAQQGPAACHRVRERGGRHPHRPVETRQAPQGMQSAATFVLPPPPLPSNPPSEHMF